MPLEPLQLDDLTWSDLATAARDRIAGASRGQWTLHAPVDPGITLIELYASQLEQRLYWMNQPSTELDEAILNLHGAQRKTVQCAKTVLSFYATEGDTSRCLVVPRHTLAIQSSATTVRRFRTTRRITILPLHCDQQITSGIRRQHRVVRKYKAELFHDVDGQLIQQDLQLGGSVYPALLAANQAYALTRIRFPFCPIEVPKGIKTENERTEVISIFVDLDTLPTVRPQWHTENSEQKQIGPPSAVHWQLSVKHFINGNEETESPFEIKTYCDGTNGLRNSGIIHFRVKNLFVDRLAQRPFLELRVSADTRQFTFAPRVKQIVPNAVFAEHRQRFIQRMDTQFHKLPGNQLELSSETDDFLIPDESLRLVLIEKPIGSKDEQIHIWRYASSFAHEGPKSRVFFADREQGKLEFGDGLHGRIPVPSKTDVCVAFEVGGGASGNVAANSSWIVKSDQAKFEAINVVPATGGADAESVEDALRRFRSDLRKVSRAVTREDIESLAIETPEAGIARARAVIGLHPGFPTVRTPGASSLFVVPDLPASLRAIVGHVIKEDLTALYPDRAAMRAVSRWLATKRLLTQEIFVCQPQYEEVDLDVLLQGSPYDKEQTEREICKALREYLHPLLGGPEGRGWPFGGAIRPSELMRQLDLLVAPELRIVEVGIHKHPRTEQSCARNHEELHAPDHPSDQPQFDACNDTLIDDHSLVALRSIRLSYVAERRTGGLQ